MVSSDGGARGAATPVWRDDGRELYYERGSSVLAVGQVLVPNGIIDIWTELHSAATHPGK
jgi:hypothetical protein